jgi:hypothetical protein
VLTEDIASCAVADLCASGAFSHVGDAWRYAGVTGQSGTTLAAAPWAQEVPSWAPVVIPASRMRGREIAAAPLAKTLLGKTTVRTQPTYNFTRVMAAGNGTAGPHRWRLPD